MKFYQCFFAAAVYLIAMIPGILLAQDAIQTRNIRFAAGNTTSVISSSIKGRQIIDYVVSAKAGQKLNVKLKTNNTANYFNVLPPGSNDEAIFIGSRDGNSFTSSLTTEGAYKIRVYLIASAARRNESAKFTLTIGMPGVKTP